MLSQRAYYTILLCLLVATLLSPTNAEETTTTSSSSSSTTTTSSRPQKPINPDTDWGSFYDPKNVFCGKYDCYKILGFDYLTWGNDPPSHKEITKSYRSLSRQWHPDKNKARGAREKFVVSACIIYSLFCSMYCLLARIWTLDWSMMCSSIFNPNTTTIILFQRQQQQNQQAIAKAYEVLTDSTKRAEYDHFRDRPDEYFRKYGSGVLWEYAPKSDATIVIILFLVLGSAFTYYAQKNRWQTIANHLIKAAVEDWSTAEGASAESVEIREKALGILAEQKKAVNGVEEEKEEVGGSKKGKAGDKKKKGSKMTSKEKKEKEMDELRPIVVKLVNEIDDFGAGFRKPTFHDLLGESADLYLRIFCSLNDKHMIILC